MSQPSDAVEKFRVALDLYEAGVELMQCNLRRRHPTETDEQIEARLAAWLLERPGAEHGDAPGRPGHWPRQ